jgi:hypothetical protein
MISAVFAVLSTLALVQPAAAGGFLLQLQDAQSVVEGSLNVHLLGSDGTERHIEAADDGKMPDVSAGDHTFAVPVPSFADASVEIKVESGIRTWSVSTAVPLDDEKPLVRVVLGADGSARVAQAPAGPSGGPMPGPSGPSAGMPGPNASGGGPPSGAGGQLPSLGNAPGLAAVAAPAQASILVNGVLMAGMGVGMGATMVWLRRGRVRAARLAVPPMTPLEPVRISGQSVDDVVDGPLAAHRIVVLDTSDAPCPSRPHVFRCEEQGVTPRELTLAVETLAATPGPPVALLVSDLSALDRPGPSGAARALADAVAGRFPLYVVDGPDAWAAWPEQVAA